MDLFYFLYNNSLIAIIGILQLFFIIRLTDKNLKIWYFFIYIFLLYIDDTVVHSTYLAIGFELLILYGISHFILKNSNLVSIVISILAIYISQLSFGIINPLECLLFPKMLGKPSLLYLIIVFVSSLAIMLCLYCYKLILKQFPFQNKYSEIYMWLLLPSELFFSVIEFYILHTFYSEATIPIYPTETIKHLALLIFQLLGLILLFCILYLYKRTCDGFQTQVTLSLLTQEIYAQKNYVSQAQLRYEKTQAFRHDIKNHLSVLEGLLKKENLTQAKIYLQKLNIITKELSFPIHTNNPVLDILLGEKIELAKSENIEVEVSLTLPSSCIIDDLDLCIIFSNALDNAIRACTQVNNSKAIRIIGERQGDFYMIEFENTCIHEPLQPIGIGLTNIETVAKKYGGTINIEKSPFLFRLNVLLNISIQLNDISKQST